MSIQGIPQYHWPFMFFGKIEKCANDGECLMVFEVEFSHDKGTFSIIRTLQNNQPYEPTAEEIREWCGLAENFKLEMQDV